MGARIPDDLGFSLNAARSETAWHDDAVKTRKCAEASGMLFVVLGVEPGELRLPVERPGCVLERLNDGNVRIREREVSAAEIFPDDADADGTSGLVDAADKRVPGAHVVALGAKTEFLQNFDAQSLFLKIHRDLVDTRNVGRGNNV